MHLPTQKFYLCIHVRMTDVIVLWISSRNAQKAYLLSSLQEAYKKLSCCRETARRFVSLKILLSHSSHSRSFEMTVLGRAWVNGC